MAWELVKTRRYPALDTYSGEYGAVVCEFNTGPEQLPFMNSLGEWLADRIPAQAVKEGVTPLWLTVHRDTEPTWITRWSVQFWGHGSPMPLAALLPLLPLIIKAALAVFLAVAGFLVVREFSGLWQATPQELEREAEREQFVERLITEHDVSPADALSIVEGTKAPPAGVELPEGADLWKAAAPAIGIGVGLLVLLGLVVMATGKK